MTDRSKPQKPQFPRNLGQTPLASRSHPCYGSPHEQAGAHLRRLSRPRPWRSCWPGVGLSRPGGENPPPTPSPPNKRRPSQQRCQHAARTPRQPRVRANAPGAHVRGSFPSSTATSSSTLLELCPARGSFEPGAAVPGRLRWRAQRLEMGLGVASENASSCASHPRRPGPRSAEAAAREGSGRGGSGRGGSGRRPQAPVWLTPASARPWSAAR